MRVGKSHDYVIGCWEGGVGPRIGVRGRLFWLGGACTWVLGWSIAWGDGGVSRAVWERLIARLRVV